MKHRLVQQIAKGAMAYAREAIRPGMALREVCRLCEEKMLALGANPFWCRDVGAFIFAGDETAVSVSGRNYRTSGHSIAGRKEDRIYIEKGNSAPLGSVPLFTFEPHISLPGSEYRYEKENIYFLRASS